MTDVTGKGGAFDFWRNPQERRLVVTGFFLLFCVLGGYFAVRPVRETIGTIIGRGATQDLWIFTAIFALIIVPLYGWLVAHIRRSVLVPVIYAFMCAGFIATAIIFQTHSEGAAFAKVFYVWISVMNVMLVSVFWSFMLEVVSSEQAKRLFGPIFAGGTAGAFLGPFITGRIVMEVGNVGVLWLGAAMFAIAVVLQRLLMAEWRRMTPDARETLAPTDRDRALGGNPFAGFALVFRSPYLTGIALFIVGISAINTFLYFEQLQLVEEQFEEIAKRTQVFANLDAIVQGLVIITQLFLTGFVATRFGVTLLLVLVPIVMVFGLGVYAVSGTFVVMAVAMVVRRWGEYALIRPGREMLFSKVDKESKYKAKNLCDVAVYRVADAGFAQLKKILDALQLGGAAQAMIAAGVAVLWAFNGWWLGRKHDKAGPGLITRPGGD
jgi:AAA family ATP:ADP antiporter